MLINLPFIFESLVLASLTVHAQDALDFYPPSHSAALERFPSGFSSTDNLLSSTFTETTSDSIINTVPNPLSSVKAMAPETGSASSSGSPVRVGLDVEKYPVAPDGLQLEQVHVFVRHGERTPVGVRLAGPPGNVPEHWTMCKSARSLHSAVASVLDGAPGGMVDEMMGTRRLVERADGTIVEGECLLGELTDLGRRSTYEYGQNLRKLYVDKLGFLPDRLEQGNATYFRSTNMPRTIESLHQIIHGLYPSAKCSPTTVPTVIVRNGKDENLLGNTYACKRLEILQIGFAQAAAAAYNHTLEPLDKKISKYLGGNPIRVDGKPRASGVLDTVRAAVAHGVKVPPEFEDKSIVDVIEKAVVNEWFAGYKTEEVRRLGMGRMLDNITRRMQSKVEQGPKDPLKILVHSTHDTALAAVCSTLDVYDEKWPAFTASVTFELFRKDPEQSAPSIFQTVMRPFKSSPTPSDYYVRMRYQNRNMILPMCSEEGRHLQGSPELCTLAAFKERVKELTPIDWKEECSPTGRTP